MTSREPARAPSTLARVREVFGSVEFRRLFATRAVSQIGDGIFQLATADLLLFNKPTANAALSLTLLSVVTLIPFSMLSPFVGVFIDRWERRTILEVVPIVRAVLALTIGLGLGRVKQGILFYVVVLIILSANRLFLATISAVLPQVVPADDLLVANSIASTGGSVANALGLGMGAALSALMGGTRAAGASAVAFAIGAVVARRMHVHRGTTPVKAPIRQEVNDVLFEMRDGFHRLRENKRVSFALSAVMTNQLAVGAMSAAAATFYISVLHLKIRSVTTVLGALTTGLAVGVVIVPLLARRMRHDRLIPVSFVVAGIAVAFTAATLSKASVVIGAGIVGLAYAMTKIPVDTIVQEEMPDSHRGRAFAVYDMLFNFARVGGTALCALAVAASLKPRVIVALIAGAYAILTVVFVTREHRLNAPAAPAEQRSPRPPAEDAEDAEDAETGAEAGADLPAPAATVSDETAPVPDTAPPARPEGLFPVGELVTVRSYAGHRAEVEPRSIIVGGREIPVDSIEWRAVEERLSGERRQIFVVRAGGERIRLASGDDSERWEVERVLPS